MTVYVDTLMTRDTAWLSTRRGYVAAESCHLFTDGDPEELHAFAARMCLKRKWFQDHPLLPHYDLSTTSRALAVRMGAAEVENGEAVRLARARLLRYESTGKWSPSDG